jgi:hypothetical protein
MRKQLSLNKEHSSIQRRGVKVVFNGGIGYHWSRRKE